MKTADWDVLIQESDFYHVVQPIIDLSTDSLYGYEVLLRSHGFENPESLFKYAKEQEQLFELDMNAISKAIGTFKKGKSNIGNLYLLFINVFPSTLINPNFYDELMRIKAALKFKPCSIVFEINEAEKIQDLTAMRQMILKLKKQGFLIALDDIGKGESSLKSILELEPNIAKIDRYFAYDLSISSRKQKLIKLVLQLFGNDTIMILEGFEREADLLKAKELGASYGQGFYLGRPEPLSYYL